jgi:HPt (histidine-containing phosphotransfer) domain-containing protein
MSVKESCTVAGEQAGEPAVSSIPWTELRSSFGDDTFVKEILGDMKNEMDEGLTSISSALSNNPVKLNEVYTMAHKIKGSASSINLSYIAGLANELCVAVKSTDLKTVLSFVEKLDGARENFCKDLKCVTSEHR